MAPGCGDANVGGSGPNDEGGAAVPKADAGGGEDAGATADGSAGPSDAGTVVANCTQGTILTQGSSVTFNAATSGNKQRDYCVVVPASATAVEFNLSGGSCTPYKCMGNDVHLFLKQGEVPDAFAPDGATKEWTYAPGGSGVFGKFVKGGGVFYLSLRDDANTLGYKGVNMSVTIK